jgi:hypothetical protein
MGTQSQVMRPHKAPSVQRLERVEFLRDAYSMDQIAATCDNVQGISAAHWYEACSP